MYFNDKVDKAKPITGTRELNNMLSYCFIKYEYITTITYVRIIIQIFLVQLVSQDLSNSTLLFSYLVILFIFFYYIKINGAKYKNRTYL